MITYIVVANGRVEHIHDISEAFALRRAQATWGDDVRMMGMWTGCMTMEGEMRRPIWWN